MYFYQFMYFAHDIFYVVTLRTTGINLMTISCHIEEKRPPSQSKWHVTLIAKNSLIKTYLIVLYTLVSSFFQKIFQSVYRSIKAFSHAFQQRMASLISESVTFDIFSWLFLTNCRALCHFIFTTFFKRTLNGQEKKYSNFERAYFDPAAYCLIGTFYIVCTTFYVILIWHKYVMYFMNWYL